MAITGAAKMDSQGRLITFYSYKGGTGRTMALANVACLLARSTMAASRDTPSRRVLAIDWDLEAPGLDRYFAPLLDQESKGAARCGVIDLFEAVSKRVGSSSGKGDSADSFAEAIVRDIELSSFISTTREPGLDFMPAGNLNADYPKRIASFDWERLLHKVPALMPALARRLAREFSYVLIDSRTGLSDTSGICTALLPDVLVTVFTPNLQSMLGLTGVIQDVIEFRSQSPDTRRLLILPLPSRIETARPSLLEYWRKGSTDQFHGYQNQFEAVLKSAYGLDHCDLTAYFDEVQVQHIPDYAYGEEIAVISEAASDNRLSLKRSYEDFTNWLLADAPPWIHPSDINAARETRQLCDRASHAIDSGELDSGHRFIYLALDQPETARISEGPQLADVLARLSSKLARAGRVAEAEEAIGQATNLAELALGSDDPAAVIYAERRAELLDRLGRIDEARELLQTVVERRLAAFGREHIGVAEAYEKLAAVFGRIGRATESEKALTEALTVRRALFGVDQPFIRGDLGGLANTYSQVGSHARERGNYEVAEEWYRLCLAIYAKLSDPSGLADCYQQLGDLARERGDFDAGAEWDQMRLGVVRESKLAAPSTPTPRTATLRLTTRQRAAVGQGREQLEVSWQDGYAHRTAVSSFGYLVSQQDSEKIRWYLEDFAESHDDLALRLAQDVETRLAQIGSDLFRQVFSGQGAAEIWAQAAGQLGRVRVEVCAEPADADFLPWELLRDPGSDTYLARGAGAFVRTRVQAPVRAGLRAAVGDRLRVLLVISRPARGHDVPFRSVASRLVRGGVKRVAAMDVLRPATFTRLSEVLNEAASTGLPYHVVHFDGHGIWLDASSLAGSKVPVAGRVRDGKHGYLLFEDPSSETNQQLVDGATLGRLLIKTQVSLLILGASRSAYAEPAEPSGDAGSGSSDTWISSGREGAKGGETEGEDVSIAGQPIDLRGQLTEDVSLAAEVADAGVPGVVAMRYNMYVVTAAQFAADLYAHLLAGRSLGEAATAARRTLAADPTRRIGAAPVALQDWIVPVVYEAAPVILLRPEKGAVPLIQLTPSDYGDDTARAVLPTPPDAGFFGRDETLLALDRAFDTQAVVLLHALAGAGKSSTAAEFARWYQATGGLNNASHPEWGSGPVLWTSFEHHLTLARLLDTAGELFAGLLEASGVYWQAITSSAQRRDLVMQILAQLPMLWVWDNVGPVTGLPAGTKSDWTLAEQDELAGFLRDLAQGTQCKVLLTSRREEHAWLADLPARVQLPPMPIREQLQLASAIASRHGDLGTEVDWRPLLRYAAGNPLTITVLVGQALRENLTTTADIEAYVSRLRAGEEDLKHDEDTALGQTRSLAASLDYGFTHAFTDAERDQLAVLHLFRDTVDVDALCAMGDPKIARDDAVPQLSGLTREAGTVLLDRAADIGLLASLGGGYYAIHPALPWYFTTLFTVTFGTPDHPEAAGPARAYAHALAELGRYYHNEYRFGRTERTIAALRAEEANLRQALTLARANKRWPDAVGCLQGLDILYSQTGQAGEWTRLLHLLIPEVTDPATDQPLVGREDEWSTITSYRVRLAIDARDWPTAIRLQHAAVAWAQEKAATAQATPTGELTSLQRNQLGNLAVSLAYLGHILREQNDPGCLPYYEEALSLYQRIGARTEEGRLASSLGDAYVHVPGLRDLDQAERWLRQSLNCLADNDQRARAKSLTQAGSIAFERFRDAQAAGAAETELLQHLNAALRSYQEALDLTPTDDIEDLTAIGLQLGNVYSEAGDTPQALKYFQQSVMHQEARGNVYGAAQIRRSMAVLLMRDGRASDALHHARAALRDFERVGPGAAEDAAKTRQLLAQLEGT